MRVIGLLLFLTMLLPSGEPLEVDANPSVAFAPGWFRIIATVEPHQDNERLTLVADSYKYRTSSMTELHGLNAAKTHDLIVKNAPAGEYEVQAIVERSDGTTLVRSTTVLIK